MNLDLSPKHALRTAKEAVEQGNFRLAVACLLRIVEYQSDVIRRLDDEQGLRAEKEMFSHGR